MEAGKERLDPGRGAGRHAAGGTPTQERERRAEAVGGGVVVSCLSNKGVPQSSSWSKSKLINARGVVAIFLLSSKSARCYFL